MNPPIHSSAGRIICENCGRSIPKTQHPHSYMDSPVCTRCYSNLSGKKQDGAKPVKTLKSWRWLCHLAIFFSFVGLAIGMEMRDHTMAAASTLAMYLGMIALIGIDSEK
ncbi:MAG TPA: hypothetical protein VHD56_08840 [Tepidisphaeraceae bacterium]|nr:hypothetical protein [Tepidisphaeraceae bacterium]